MASLSRMTKAELIERVKELEKSNLPSVDSSADLNMNVINIENNAKIIKLHDSVMARFVDLQGSLKVLKQKKYSIFQRKQKAIDKETIIRLESESRFLESVIALVSEIVLI